MSGVLVNLVIDHLATLVVGIILFFLTRSFNNWSNAVKDSKDSIDKLTGTMQESLSRVESEMRQGLQVMDAEVKSLRSEIHNHSQSNERRISYLEGVVRMRRSYRDDPDSGKPFFSNNGGDKR